MKLGRLTSAKHMRGLFLLCWAMYFSSYIGRLNYSAVMSELIGSRLSMEQAGWISTVFLLAYALGQFINGLLAERLSPRWMVCCGLLGSACGNFFFPFAPDFLSMLLLRLLTGYSMSMLWPSMLRALATMMDEQGRLRYSIHLSSSMAAGTLCAYLLCAGMLHALDWRYAFFVPALFLALLALAWFLGFGYLEKRTEVVTPSAEESAPAEKALPLAQLLLAPGILAMFIPAMLHGALKDGVTAWMPTYISDVFLVDPAFSSLLLTALPVINVSGAYIAQAVYKALRSEVRSMAVFFLAAAAALGILILSRENLVITIAMFAVITSSMLAVNVLLVNVLPMRYQGVGRTATLSGMFNAVAYGGSALASGLIGMITAAWGWNSAVISWLLCMAVAFAACLGIVWRKSRDV